jgi:four helix bundle protein
MAHQFAFEKLTVWQDSKDLVKLIYQLTNQFPEEEKFGLKSQLRRASISVSSNLAEGSSRTTNKDKAHFTNMSYSSLMEVLNQIIIANELKFIKDEDYAALRKLIEKISNKLNSLRKSQLNSQTTQQLNG